MEKDSYQITFESWDKLARAYQDKFMDLTMYDDSYGFFLSHLTNVNSKILELGCGPGNISRYLLKCRPDLFLCGMDISPSMIELAQENVPNAKFIVGDCRDLTVFKERFDAVVAGFVLPYLSENDAEKLLKQVGEKLNNDGVFYISCVEGEASESGFVTGSTGHTMYFYYYSEFFLVQLLQKNGFEILKIMREQWPDKPMEEHAHLIFIAKKLH